jgi:hypothetical protein
MDGWAEVGEFGFIQSNPKYLARLKPQPNPFGLRREAKRHAALEALSQLKSGVAAALCHRTPKYLQRQSQIANRKS